MLVTRGYCVCVLTCLWDQVLHLELDLAGSGINYQPGDSVGVSPLNDDEMVDSLMHRLEFNGQQRFEVVSAEDGSQQGLLPHLGCPCTVQRAFQAGVDITSAPRYIPGSRVRSVGLKLADLQRISVQLLRI